MSTKAVVVATFVFGFGIYVCDLSRFEAIDFRHRISRAYDLWVGIE